MKKSVKRTVKTALFLSAFLAIGAGATAQVKKKPAARPAVAKSNTAATAAALKTNTDSVSYALGMMVIGFYKQQGITDINTELVAKAMKDGLKGQPAMDQQLAQQTLMACVEKIKTEKSAGAKKEGADFLAKNKTQAGVITTTSGLQYQVLTMGTGKKPSDSSRVKCNYEGRLLDGKVFDSSDKQGHPIEFAVNGVIRGWTEALQLMPAGSKFRLFIPADLAYGDNQAGPDIKPGSTLIFDVELLEVL